jgi:hypothetical protein
MGPKGLQLVCIPGEGIGGPAHFDGSVDCHMFGHGIHERSRGESPYAGAMLPNVYTAAAAASAARACAVRSK